MAANLAAAGHRVVAWNRSEIAPPEGVELVTSPGDVADAAAVAFVMVTDAAAVDALLFGDAGWAQRARAGHALIQSSTIAPEEARALEELLAGRHIRMLDAPVSGSVEPAKAGRLTVLGGGSRRDFEEFAPLFDAIAAKTVVFGSVGSGSAVKLAVNGVLIGAVAAAAEAVTRLVESRPEIDVAAVGEVLERISPIAAKRLPDMIADAPAGGFPLRLVVKDMDLLSEHGHDGGVLGAVATLCRAAAVSGLAERDVSALGSFVRRSRTAR